MTRRYVITSPENIGLDEILRQVALERVSATP
jgi:hypothetical protein